MLEDISKGISNKGYSKEDWIYIFDVNRNTTWITVAYTRSRSDLY